MIIPVIKFSADEILGSDDSEEICEGAGDDIGADHDDEDDDELTTPHSSLLHSLPVSQQLSLTPLTVPLHCSWRTSRNYTSVTSP